MSGVDGSLFNPASPRIAIIGGGLSGLATAVQLRQLAPHTVISLFEASERVGGVIDTQRHGEWLIDYGADMFTTQPPAALRLCESLGVADHLMEPKQERRGAMIVHRGRLVPVPEGFVLMRATQLMSMLTTPLLSPQGKLRLLVERFVPRRDDVSDESVGSFVRRRMGQEVLDRIVGPLVAGIYTADVERLSMRATMAPIWKMEQEYGSLAQATLARRRQDGDALERSSSGARYAQFRAFPGGMVQLIETLHAALPPSVIHRGQAVTQMARSDSGWRLTSQNEPLGEFEHVILATPAAVSARLLHPHAASAAELLGNIEAASTAIVMLVMRRSDLVDPPRAFGFVVPAIENRQILAGSFASEKFEGRASDETVIARVFIGGALQPELLQRDDDELVKLAIGEIGSLMGLSNRPLLTHVVRWNDAMPQYHVGHLERAAAIEQEVQSLRGVSLAGNSLHGVGISPVIETAARTAREVAERWSPAGGEKPARSLADSPTARG